MLKFLHGGILVSLLVVLVLMALARGDAGSRLRRTARCAGEACASLQPSSEPRGVSGTWVLQCHDEFSGSVLDLTKWTPTWLGEGTKINGVRTYSKNASVIDGSLVLTLAAPRSGAYVHSDYGPGSCTLPVGGYAEARIFFPGSASEGIYNWPAWWVFGPNWPEAGEHDVAEGLHGKLTVNYHSGKTSAPTQLNLGMVPGTWRNAFHTYGVRRGKTSADVYWDGQLVKSYPTSDNGAPEELVFDVGAFGPPHVADESQVKVDYVRVWHCASGCANR